ncbi:MAG: ABC transporter substrate-binding protein [Rhodospirillales bacterium]|nr:ABC transporter substrate-binding protein [Rhodospirillales bacterium]MBO6788819.1 ABC transporter substrate-binding protein [Rhodospirillales bacterium]
MYSTFRKLLLLSVVLLAPVPGLASPAETVETYHDRLLRAVSDNRGQSDQARFTSLAPAMDDAFDFEGMIKTAAGSYWAKASPDERAALLSAFRRVSIATYADQFRELTDGTFTIEMTRSGPRGLKLVQSRLNTGGDSVALTYVVREIRGEWRIIDVLLKGGISELALRASEYAGTLESGGTEALTKTLNAQAASLLEN